MFAYCDFSGGMFAHLLHCDVRGGIFTHCYIVKLAVQCLHIVMLLMERLLGEHKTHNEPNTPVCTFCKISVFYSALKLCKYQETKAKIP